MGKLLEFTNGLLTNVEANSSNPNYKKRCVFKNGLLISIEETIIPASGSRYLSFKNGLLTNMGVPIYLDPQVYLGDEITYTLSVTSFSGWKFNLPGGFFNAFSVNPNIVGDDIKGVAFGIKDVVYTYPSTGYPYSYKSDIIYPGDSHISGLTRSVDTSWIYRTTPTAGIWWNQPDIKSQVYALVDNILEQAPTDYTFYKEWAVDYVNDVTTIFQLLIGAYCDSRNVGGTTYQVTYFWTPIYYGIPPF